MPDSDSELNLKTAMFRSWFCVFNNPKEHGFVGEPQEICDSIVAKWVDGHPTRVCAVTYCVSADGLEHCHVVLEDSKNIRFSAIKKAFPSMHIEPTRGSKEQAEDYINKRGKFAEKGEKIIASARFGEIKGSQGKRRKFDIIEELLFYGMTPSQILHEDFSFRCYEKIIRQAYFDKRIKETPVERDVSVYWHCGESGTGKTHTYVELCEKFGEESVYLLTDYDKGGFDNYCGERILCMDEFRGQMRFQLFMNYLDVYKVQIPCRYSNAYALWNEVHIFTVYPPEILHRKMVQQNHLIDDFSQLKRRLKSVIYHYRDSETGDFCKFELPASDYLDYENLKFKVFEANENRFSGLPELDILTPFEE